MFCPTAILLGPQSAGGVPEETAPSKGRCEAQICLWTQIHTLDSRRAKGSSVGVGSRVGKSRGDIFSPSQNSNYHGHSQFPPSTGKSAQEDHGCRQES